MENDSFYSSILKEYEKCSEENRKLKMAKEEDKHLKGYIFDSLMYRYMFARYRAMEQDINNDIKSGKERPNAIIHRMKIYDRDCMRFLEILNEAIGEHD